MPRATQFGYVITADHKVLNGENESQLHHRCAVWVIRAKSGQHQIREVCSESFLQKASLGVVDTDTSSEFTKPCDDLVWNHDKSTPRRSETTGIAGRAARRVKEGTSTLLVQSGFDEQWWEEAMEWSCYVRNIQDLWEDGKLLTKEDTIHSVCPTMPFGAGILFYPISMKDRDRLQQFSSQVLQGTFSDVPLVWRAAGQETYSWQMQKNWVTTLLQKSTSEKIWGGRSGNPRGRRTIHISPVLTVQ